MPESTSDELSRRDKSHAAHAGRLRADTGDRRRHARETLAFLGIGALVTAVTQARTSFIGLYYDDYVVFRRYAPTDVLRAFWTDLREITHPDMWVSAYRPMTLIVHAAAYELAGFDPDGLVWLRGALILATAYALWRWLRILGLSAAGASLGGLCYVVHPVNFSSFAWSTELAALTALPWLLLSVASFSRWLVGEVRSPWPSLLCWLLALLTKETVVPLVVLFPALSWLLPGRRRRLWANLAVLVALVAYLAARFTVLQGRWGAQGISPDVDGTALADYFWNYVRYLGWIVLEPAARMLPHSLLLHAFLLAPLGLAILVMTSDALGIEAGRVEPPASPEARVFLLGLLVTLAGGAICAFYADPRVMYAASVGPCMLVGLSPWLLLNRMRLGASFGGKLLTAVLCSGVLFFSALYQGDLVTHPSSEFVRFREYWRLTYYTQLGHLFERWDLVGQASHLQTDLRVAGLVDERGALAPEALRATLRERGFGARHAEQFLTWEHTRRTVGDYLAARPR